MTKPREFPYIWATWLPRLLTGERSCEWAVWFKAHHQGYQRQPSDFDQARWLVEHTAALIQAKDLFRSPGYEISVEGQNSFQLQGKTATLAGRPDLIVRSPRHRLIIDVKTGQEQPWHYVQMMVYMYAVPRAMHDPRELDTAGEIHYTGRIQRVPQGGLDQGFIQSLVALIRRIAAAEAPSPVPSTRECAMCDITVADCPERMDEHLTSHDARTDEF